MANTTALRHEESHASRLPMHLDCLTIRDLRQVGVVQNLDFVSDLALGRGLPVVENISAELGGHILIKRAA